MRGKPWSERRLDPSSLRAGPDPVRGLGVQGIIGPVMLRVAPLEFFFYGRITVAPEAGQIPGDLGRTAGDYSEITVPVYLLNRK